MNTYPGGPGPHQPNPWGQQPPGGTYYGTQPGSAPSGPAPHGGPPSHGYVPPQPKSGMLGLVTLIALGVAMVIGTVWTVFAWPDLNAHQKGGSTHYPPNVLAYVIGCLVLWLVGVTTFILGIVATATGRGRVPGIIAIVLSVLAPFITLGIGANVAEAMK